MNPDDIRDLIEGGTFAPCEIVTRSGQKYAVTDRRNAWITETYPNTLIVATRERGLSLIGLESIEAIHLEKESIR